MLKEVLLILFSVLGFFISYYIWRKAVHNKEKLVCLIGDGDCDKVVKSKYGHLFGIDNTILGMLYYVFIFLLAFIMIFYPSFLAFNYFILGEKIITGLSAGLSVLLTFIQIGIIKKICEYCMFANAINVLIFLVVMFL